MDIYVHFSFGKYLFNLVKDISLYPKKYDILCKTMHAAFKNGAGGGVVTLVVGSEIFVTKLLNISYEFQLDFNFFPLMNQKYLLTVTFQIKFSVLIVAVQNKRAPLRRSYVFVLFCFQNGEGYRTKLRVSNTYFRNSPL